MTRWLAVEQRAARYNRAVLYWAATERAREGRRPRGSMNRKEQGSPMRKHYHSVPPMMFSGLITNKARANQASSDRPAKQKLPYLHRGLWKRM
jgi:hypothetical protein